MCPEWCNKMSGNKGSQSKYLLMQVGHTFGLQVTIDKTHEVQVLQSSHYLSCVEPSSILWKTFPRSALKRPEKLTPHTILHAMVQIILRLKRMVKSHYEWVIRGSQDLLFCQRALDLFPLNHLLLGEYYRPFLNKNCKLRWSDTYLSWHKVFLTSSPVQGRLCRRHLYPAALSSGSWTD